MEDALCGECSGPLQCEGASKPVVLFPCGHLLHHDCSVYTRKTAKLSSVAHSCPTCGAQIHDTIALCVSEVAEEPGDTHGKEWDDSEEPLDVNAMLTRIFHFQRRNMMHQRRVLESKIELKSVQGTLALVHQRKSELERQIGTLSSVTSQNTDRVQNIPQEDLLGIIVQTGEEVAQKRKTLQRINALNEAKRRTLAEAKRNLARERRVDTPNKETVLSTLTPEVAFPYPNLKPSEQVGRKRPVRSDVIDVDDISDEDSATQHDSARVIPDVEVVSVVKEEHDDDGLPPLFPMRNPSNVPRMGVSFNRSLRDLPKEADSLLQTKLC